MSQDRLAALFSRTTKGVRFDLDRIRRVLALSGDPHLCAPTVLIGGTNGKGSLTAMWAEGLKAEGRRVGKYTSPHLLRFNERIAVDGVDIADAELLALFSELDRVEARAGITLTFFEAATWMAFMRFAACSVDAMVLEVGLGGRLDATNVSDPQLSLITSIGLDHTEYLGETEAAIAHEKAAIGRAGRPLVVSAVSEEALEAIEAHEAKVWALGREKSDLPSVAPAMFGPHQRSNAELFALSVTAARGTGLALAEASYRFGCEARVPGRYEVREREGVRYVIDGAHNGQAALALRASLLSDPALCAPRALIFGGTQGRPPETTLGVLAPLFDRVVLCPPRNERALAVEQMQAVVPHAIACATMAQALAACRGFAHVCVTGSLYLVGDVLAALTGIARDTAADFR